MAKTLLEMTVDIVQSQSTTTQMSSEEIKTALIQTFEKLKGLQNLENTGLKADLSGEDLGSSRQSLIEPKKSIQKNKVVCLECGHEFKILSPKHLKLHGITAKEYRKKYDLSPRQALCAKSLSEKRSQSAKERGLPVNFVAAIKKRTRKKKESKIQSET